ncbi:hypothetical protein [Mycobacterium leprae]|uniref:hypothetical protein n=1 Tax=Mycobacterium leprae TaxID=1769 RepID=UPI0003122877|nr:hypothetical protein [Mycobacterium leprae]
MISAILSQEDFFNHNHFLSTATDDVDGFGALNLVLTETNIAPEVSKPNSAIIHHPLGGIGRLDG